MTTTPKKTELTEPKVMTDAESTLKKPMGAAEPTALDRLEALETRVNEQQLEWEKHMRYHFKKSQHP
jgi:HAMP domain-containing protein